MSDPRRLWVRFRRVDRERREAYLEAVGAAGVTASGVGAHLWAFEVDGEGSLFVEFLEGPGDESLARLDGSISGTLSAAGETEVDAAAEIGSGVLKCTELG